MSSFTRSAAGDGHTPVASELDFFQLPDLAIAVAAAGLVFQEENVVLGRCRAGADATRFSGSVVDGQYSY